MTFSFIVINEKQNTGNLFKSGQKPVKSKVLKLIRQKTKNTNNEAF